MSKAKRRRIPSETERRLRRGEGEEIVVLEEGDPRAPKSDAPDWDWDAEAVSGERHCSACGAWGSVLKLEDGSYVCPACAHGGADAVETQALR